MIMTTPSDVVRQIAGTYIEDSAPPASPLHRWIQAECRVGAFREAIEKFSAQQPEPLRVDLCQVETVTNDKIILRVPCRLVDHESPSPYATEVQLAINPATLLIERL